MEGKDKGKDMERKGKEWKGRHGRVGVDRTGEGGFI